MWPRQVDELARHKQCEGRLRILIWATAMQADVLGLAWQLGQRVNSSVLVAMEGLAGFAREPIAARFPLSVELLDRNRPDIRSRVEAFRPDAVICDNHFPPFVAAPRTCTMWHGLGWKARPRSDLNTFYGHVKRLTGTDPRQRNSRFFAQCYHERDREWRVSQWGLDPGSCHVVGSCFSDLLREPPYTKAELAAHYPIDIMRRKTLLVNLTWHYGRLFPGNWRPSLFSMSPIKADLEFLSQLFACASDHRANVLFCLHDRQRYEKAYLAAIHELGQNFPGVYIKHKDEHPDNLADLLVADAMVSNLSSFVTFFYQLGRPSVHLCPPVGATDVRFSRLSVFGPRGRRRQSAPEWMNDPDDNGGLTTRSAADALEAILRALLEPECCQERASDWLSRHVWRPHGSSAAYFADQLEAWIASS